MSVTNQDKESFRNSIGTLNEEGKRAWVYPKKPKGKYYKYRKLVSYLLMLIFVASPFVKIDGNQFLMFNVLERRFNIFGFPFWPQDFYLFVISMIIGVVFVVLFTVAFGRIFCGWICPQTIFLEMIFRRVEYWIEGDRNTQIKLDKQPWDAEKIRKKVSKWLIFFIISFSISNIFLAYLIGSDQLLLYIKEGPVAHLNSFIAILIFTGVFYFIFAWFREQVCIIACPYGRLQGVLLDDRSIVVAYDNKRGEGENGRKKFRKNEDRKALGFGDCIDCFQCVHVCPTNIDIRNGTQLECINCTACIDACDEVMEKSGMPKGLIRYASRKEIDNKEKFVFTTRMKGYATVLTILIGLLLGLLFLRSNVQANILRLPGQLYQQEGEYIKNIYTYKIINKTTRDFNNITFKLIAPEGEIEIVGNQKISLPKQGVADGTLFIKIHQAFMEKDKVDVKIEVYSGQERIESIKASFSGPKSF